MGTHVRTPHAAPKAPALTPCANTDGLPGAVADRPWKRDLRGKPLFTRTEKWPACLLASSTTHTLLPGDDASTELIDARVNLRLRHEHRFLPVIPGDRQLPSVTRARERLAASKQMRPTRHDNEANKREREKERPGPRICKFPFRIRRRIICSLPFVEGTNADNGRGKCLRTCVVESRRGQEKTKMLLGPLQSSNRAF